MVSLSFRFTRLVLFFSILFAPVYCNLSFYSFCFIFKLNAQQERLARVCVWHSNSNVLKPARKRVFCSLDFKIIVVKWKKECVTGDLRMKSVKCCLKYELKLVKSILGKGRNKLYRKVCVFVNKYFLSVIWVVLR